MSGQVSWIADTLARACRAAELYSLRYSDPVEGGRERDRHLRGSVEALLLDERVRPRSEEARAVVDELRAQRELRAALKQVEDGRDAIGK